MKKYQRMIIGTADLEKKPLKKLYPHMAAEEVGELACRSVGLVKGYYNMPDKTREVIDEEDWKALPIK